jgi:hypothetical protein
MAGGDAEIVTGDLAKAPGEVVIDAGLISHFRAPHVSISLKYYQQRAECWSDWQIKDLKGFSKIIEQLRQQTADQLRGRGGSGSPPCKDHKGPPVGSGFVRPKDVSEDKLFYEIYVHDKARVHGFFVDPIFFLVWLDRGHRVFPRR